MTRAQIWRRTAVSRRTQSRCRLGGSMRWWRCAAHTRLEDSYCRSRWLRLSCRQREGRWRIRQRQRLRGPGHGWVAAQSESHAVSRPPTLRLDGGDIVLRAWYRYRTSSRVSAYETPASECSVCAGCTETAGEHGVDHEWWKREMNGTRKRKQVYSEKKKRKKK